ncbi:MAG: bacillithiol biosynthesis BshC, partial [Candidatus Eisenbacteria bacterium]
RLHWDAVRPFGVSTASHLLEEEAMKGTALPFELGLFRFPRLFLDYLSQRLPPELSSLRLLDAGRLGNLGKPGDGSPGKRLWDEVLEYNLRIGAGEGAAGAIRALASGDATAICTGQQPGLFGGPLYTLYKTATAVSLSEELSRRSGRTFVPVFWSAADDSDFAEVSRADFFASDLSSRRFAVRDDAHTTGLMVGAMSTAALLPAVDQLMREFGGLEGSAYLDGCIEDAISVSQDWGEFVSSLLIRLLRPSDLVVVDSRLGSVQERSRRVVGTYLERREQARSEIDTTLRRLETGGYALPVTQRSAEVCLFVKEGGRRRKLLREELKSVSERWEKGEVELLPNVLLGPVVRDDVLGSAANVVGPSEICYYVVASAIYRALDLTQAPVVPRLSQTIVPESVVSALGLEPEALSSVVTSFDAVVSERAGRSVPPDVARELALFGDEVDSGFGRVERVAPSLGRSLEEVAASSRRRVESEVRRVRGEFLAAARKRLLAESPVLRRAREFVCPGGDLQERGYCCLSPVVHKGERFVGQVRETAASHVSRCLEGRFYHHIVTMDIP